MNSGGSFCARDVVAGLPTEPRPARYRARSSVGRGSVGRPATTTEEASHSDRATGPAPIFDASRTELRPQKIDERVVGQHVFAESGERAQ